MFTLGAIHHFVKAAMQVSENSYDNETFVEVRDRTPIAGLSVESKSFCFYREELFYDATNSGN